MCKIVEFKFRKRGVITTVELGLRKEEIPITSIPLEMNGIDLTRYKVVHAVFGRHGKEKALDLHSKILDAILIYQYEWTNGWGEGLLLPINFKQGKVSFYKSKRQLVEQKEREEKERLNIIVQEVRELFPNYKVGCDYNNMAYAKRRQETFSDWKAYGLSREELLADIQEKIPIWEEWNKRALELYKDLGLSNPGVGNIQVYPSPTQNHNLGIGIQIASEKWVVFHEHPDGSWEKGEIVNCAPRSF